MKKTIAVGMFCPINLGRSPLPLTIFFTPNSVLFRILFAVLDLIASTAQEILNFSAFMTASFCWTKFSENLGTNRTRKENWRKPPNAIGGPATFVTAPL
jgi:hypothetical protein